LDFQNYLKSRQDQVNRFLKEYIENYCPDDFRYLKEAIAYSLLSGGKRVRPILAMASCNAVGGDENKALPFGCALEMIHTFSLIHDDLPAMDNDDYRRNMLTNHKVYGDAHAVLAGDALLSEAFRLMSDRRLYPGVDAETGLEIMREVADAAGICGMVGGQSLDLLCENKEIEERTLHLIHLCKTARFIAVAVVVGGLVAKADDEKIKALRFFGENLGKAFQIVDDILNETGDADAIGKSVGSDARRGKATFPALYGIEKSRRKAREFSDNAIDALDIFGEKAEILREIARYVVKRDR
jgi:geranylgeranyl diphosphate synthase, type II